MTEPTSDDLLARLAAGETAADGTNPWAAIASTLPAHDAHPTLAPQNDNPDAVKSNESGHGVALDEMCRRITNLVGGSTVSDAARYSAGEAEFLPIEPASLTTAGLTDSEVEALVLKFLLNRGSATGREIAEQVKLPFVLIDMLLAHMKIDQMLFHKGSSVMNDYEYQISDAGRERARRYFAHCTYFGSAPVPLEDYIASVTAQSIAKQSPTIDDLRKAFADLLLNQNIMNRLGPAINSGRGLFLYGAPGNGKTSIAERVTKSFGETIWIPRALGIDGEILRVYDPANHFETPLESGAGLIDQRKIDKRWIRIRRPTIVVGGELTMDALEIRTSKNTGISEAPLQMKSNCGTLVIDDFGRQRMTTDELLNRWIVPLENRHDFLNLGNGKKIQVPFDQLIVFSTNLEPRDLVDEAFLRRIPYKIEVPDPSEAEFRELFQLMATKLGFVYREEAVDYLIETHYRQVGRPFRCCQPRDLLTQVRNFCRFQNQSLEMSPDNLDFAVQNYFAVM
jgi:hypothetical protein